MGLRFRRSINLGGFRINISKSGIGYSWGIPGARYTKTATGRERITVGIPGTGISWVQESSGKKKQKYNKHAVQKQQNIVDTKYDDPTVDLTKVDMKRVSSDSYGEFIAIANQYSWMEVFGMILLLSGIMAFAYPICFLTGIIGIIMVWYVKRNLLVNVTYEFEDYDINQYEEMHNLWKKASHSIEFIETVSSAKINDQKKNANANQRVTAKRVRVKRRVPCFIHSNFKPTVLELSNRILFLFPDKLIVEKGLRFAAIDYSDLDIFVGSTMMITDKKVSDSNFVTTVWARTNRDGSRDLRYKDNKQLNQYEYGIIKMMNPALDVEIMFSKIELLEEFNDLFERTYLR